MALSRTGKIVDSKKIKKEFRKSVSCPSSDSSTSYAYKILPGNNTRVLFITLSKRPWLQPAKEQKPKANFIWEMYRNPNRYKTSKYARVVLNHIENNACLVTKHGLYESIKQYCAENGSDMSTITPLTFHLRPHGRVLKEEDQSEMTNFLKYNETINVLQAAEADGEVSASDSCVWILKPSSCANRGMGILMERGVLGVLRALGYPAAHAPSTDTPPESVSSPAGSGGPRGYIVQRYMESPMLVHGRKFDIRCFLLLVLRDGSLKAYAYRDGYVRTSGSKYSMKNIKDRATHLTNDSVQKKASNYGKHEAANKLTYSEWQGTVEQDYPDAPPNVVFATILPAIREQMRVSVMATKKRLEQSCVRRSFELLGFDFMVDSHFRPTLIEVNSNPSLEFSCPMLEQLLSGLVENVFSVAVDQLVPPPRDKTRSRAAQQAVETIAALENKFEELDLNLPASQLMHNTCHGNASIGHG
jgi:hypothetical protein